jgi:CRP-like cAMP-binding protein
MQDDPLYQLFESSQLISYKPGEIIARADDDPSDIYYIKSGYVRVYSINSRGEECLHIIYRAGEVFPIIWLTGKVQRSVYYEALSGATTYKMAGKTLTEKAQVDAKLSYALTQQVIHQFNVYVDRVDNLEYKFGRERLAYCVLFLASRFGKHTSRGVLIDVFITQKTIGSSISLSRETVARELRRLEDRGLVTYEDRKLLILDVAQLCNELKDSINPDFWGLK